MNTLLLRIVIDTEEDIFRDIAIREDQHLEELHDAIIHSFDFGGNQMASFYMSNDKWEKGQEIGLMDLSAFDGDNSTPSMKNTLVSSFLKAKHEKMLYVYDFLKMWIFYVEVISIDTVSEELTYPAIVTEFGEAPSEDSKELPDLFDGIDLGTSNTSSSDDGLGGDYDDMDEDEDDPFSEFEDSYDF